MTCIVGMVEDGTMYLAGDSCGSNGHNVRIYSNPKVFKKDRFIMGYTSSFRMGQVLEHVFIPPQYNDSYSCVYEYMVQSFIPALINCFDASGFCKNTSGVKSGGCFIVGFRGELFTIEDDFQVACYSDSYGTSYHAIGSGAETALGALYALRDVKCKPSDRLKCALDITSELIASVEGPFTVIER